MNTKQLHHNSTDWLFDSQLAPYADAFKHHLVDGHYASNTAVTYISCIAHFAKWLTLRLLSIQQIDEAVVQEFFDVHLPHCNCTWPACRVRHDLRAALGHLLVVLRANSVIAEQPQGITPVDVELRCFDEHMNHIRGLAPKTRGHYLHIIRCLLNQHFSSRDLAIPSIMPDDVRQFLASQSTLYRTPASAGILVSALRGYFRFRTAYGDQVNHLIGVASYPANWKLASLPKALSNDEVIRLLGAIGDPNQSSRRDLAIVRCALDLGLRSAEVAKLGLDDRLAQSHCEKPRVGAKSFCPCPKLLVAPLQTI